jgi:hypothetical protein
MPAADRQLDPAIRGTASDVGLVEAVVRVGRPPG